MMLLYMLPLLSSTLMRMMQVSSLCWLYTGGSTVEVMDVTETERLWILGLLLQDGGEERGLSKVDIPEEFVSIEWIEEHDEEDSESFFWGSSGVSMGVVEPSSTSEWFDSQDDTLTESMLSPELPLAVDLGCSLVGVLLGIMSDPRNRLQKTKRQALRQAGTNLESMVKQILSAE